MNCRSMAQVMEARLAARSASSTQTRMIAQLLKCTSERVHVYLFSFSPHKEGRVSLTGISKFLTTVCIGGERLSGLGTKRYGRAVEKLRLAHHSESIGQINVRHRQGQKFGGMYTPPVHQKKARL